MACNVSPKMTNKDRWAQLVPDWTKKKESKVRQLIYGTVLIRKMPMGVAEPDFISRFS